MDYPKKRGAAGALFFNEKGQVLLLETTYKDDWEIPGGVIENIESPKEACEREVIEELGLNIKLGQLLCLEYQREGDDSYMFVFDGGILTSNDIGGIKIQEKEIRSFGFYDLDDIQDKVLDKMFARIKNSIEAKGKGGVLYYETIYK